MTKNEFKVKYEKEINTLSRERDVDTGVAMDMLVAHVRNRNKSVDELLNEDYFYNFKGCEDLYYEELEKYICEIEDAGEIPKLI